MSIFRICWRLAEIYTRHEAIAGESMLRADRALPRFHTVCTWFAPEGTKSNETEEVAPGILLDFDANGRAIGIEVLDVRERLGAPLQSEPAKAAE
jgi:uncharacterized protein YuzE